MAWFPCLMGSGGGGSTLITKSITQNGTYNAQDDNADGYSQVTVSVSGGGSGSDTFIPQYTETKILDNSVGSITTVTFTEDYHNYPMLRIVAYNVNYSRYFSFFAIPEGIDAAFAYSNNLFNINEFLFTNMSPSSTNQYCTYQKNSNTEWQRYAYRGMYIYEVYGLTFTNCTLQKTEIYSRQGIGSATVTPTPLAGKTFFDYDVLIYMACSSDRTETQFGPTFLNPPKAYFQGTNCPAFFGKYNAVYVTGLTPTSIGTQLYFYVAGLTFVAT